MSCLIAFTYQSVKNPWVPEHPNFHGFRGTHGTLANAATDFQRIQNCNLCGAMKLKHCIVWHLFKHFPLSGSIEGSKWFYHNIFWYFSLAHQQLEPYADEFDAKSLLNNWISLVTFSSIKIAVYVANFHFSRCSNGCWEYSRSLI